MSVLDPLPKTLRRAGRLNVRQSELLCTVEFGLFLQSAVMPQAAAAEARVLFSGYPYAEAAGVPLSVQHERFVRIGRYSLWAYRRRSAWLEALDSYQKFDPDLRGFEVADVDRPAQRLSVFVGKDRWDAYQRLLLKMPPFEGRELPVADPGGHWFPAGRTTARVTLPASPRPPRPVRHSLGQRPRGEGRPLVFTRCELLKTATVMDRIDARQGRDSREWAETLRGIDLSVADGPGFRSAEQFTIDGIQHLLGIVGVGKSTLRDIVTVHMARRKLRITVVVGDVADALKLVESYNRYTACAAAPVIGISGRQDHAQRLHRRLAGRARYSLLDHDDSGFAYLSSSCVLNAVRDEADPLAFHEAPCTGLRPVARGGESEPGSEGGRDEESDEDHGASRQRLSRRACPYWSVCPRHHGSRKLVDAGIWVTTPQALVNAPVPWPQNGERLRYLELACRRSDLIIVDEADRVQTQLDQMFAPATTLLGSLGSRSFLDEVNQHKIRELSEGRRLQLSDRDVETWSAALNTATAATDRLFAMLVAGRDLRKWVRTGYFSAWTLHHALLEDLYPLDGNQVEARASAGVDNEDGEVSLTASDPSARAIREEMERRLAKFRRNPFGDRSPREGGDPALTEMLAEVLHTSHQGSTRTHLTAQLLKQFSLDAILSRKKEEHDTAVEEQEQRPRKRRKLPPTREEWFARFVRRFEFSLLVAALEPKLVVVNGMWPRVASALSLGQSEMYRQPADYGPVVPEAPMGNLLGFQFKVHGPDKEQVASGELRFFRCGGVGRELLRALPSWQTLDDMPGTNVLLMSGSSWAGSSTRYHLAVPVGLVIKPPPKDSVALNDRVHLRFEPVRPDGEALQVSGADMSRRSSILCRMAVHLATDGGEGNSRLHRELLALPEERRRLLLLVGSYEEAKAVADALHALTAWKGWVASLVADDDDLEDYAFSATPSTHQAPVLRRGEVENLVESGYRILVAPLLAVERGHNILNKERVAALGTVYFLARPNPRPDDLGLAVQSINDWVVRSMDDGSFDGWLSSGETVSAGVDAFRAKATSTWYSLLARSLAWSRLGKNRVPVTWDMLVLIWQVIGRLLRGGVDARVVFVDAAFLPRLAAREADGRDTGDDETDDEKTSLLHSMFQVLRPYFESVDTDPEISGQDRFIVEALYGPLWHGLRSFLSLTLEGVDR